MTHSIHIEYLRASADIVKYAWVDAPNANVPSLGAVSENKSMDGRGR
jgi:hypothetical protein